MRRYLPQTITAILVAATLAWGQFKGPDTKPRGHTPQPVRLTIPISGQPIAGQVWAMQCADTILFPSNFVGAFPDANSVASCGTSPSEPDIYLVKVAGTQIGTVTLTPSAISLAQPSVSNAIGAASVSATLPTVTAGDAVVAIFAAQTTSRWPGDTNGSTISSSPSNTWACCPATPIQDANGNGQEIQICYATNVAGGSTSVTVNLGISEAQGLILSEYKGVAPSTAQDVCGAGNTAGASTSTAVNTGTITTTNGNDVIITGWAVGAISISSGAPTNGTALNGVNNLTALSLYGAYQPVSTIQTSYTANSWTAGTAVIWVSEALALKGGATVVGCTPTFATTGAQAQSCTAGQRLEVDAPNPATGTNHSITLAGHQP